MSRPKVSVYMTTSIDGYISRPDEAVDFLELVETEGEDYGYAQFLKSVDALILGRKTFEAVSETGEWPYKGKRVIVLSDKMSAIRKEAELYYGDIETLLTQLKTDGIHHVWVDGGITISRFLELDLIDQIIISVVPILLGAGIRCFKTIAKDHPCRLIHSQSFPSGLVQLTYTTL